MQLEEEGAKENKKTKTISTATFLALLMATNFAVSLSFNFFFLCLFLLQVKIQC